MYVKITNGNVDTYPYNVGRLRRDNPNTSFPKRISDGTLAAWGVYPVEVKSPPNYNDRTQRLVENTQPHMENGNWCLGWSVSDKTVDEVQTYDAQVAENNRAKRDSFISETDWWASSDLTMTAEQTSYRQALRDITSHANWPHLDEADWPTKP